MIQLSLKTMTILSTFLHEGAERAEKEIKEIEVMRALLKIDMIAERIPDEIRKKAHKFGEMIEDKREIADSLKNAFSELIENVEDFKRVHESTAEVERLSALYKKAEGWSLEEKTAFENLYRFCQENRPYISFTKVDINAEYREYMDKWREKNAGK